MTCPPPRPPCVNCNGGGCRSCCNDEKLQRILYHTLVRIKYRPSCPSNKQTSASECQCKVCVLNRHREKGNGGKPVKVTQFFNHNGTLKQKEYSEADPLTQTLVCDYLDKIGKLFCTNGLTLPDGYLRFAKYVRCETKVPKTSASERKREYITCPLKLCYDRRGLCECMCHKCYGIKTECSCQKC